MSLPAVPTGANPFTVYSSALYIAFYPTPSPGLQVRLSLLLGLYAIGFLLAAAHLALHTIDARRREKGGNSLWMAHLVERPSGRYVVINTKIVSSIFAIINCVLQVAYVVDIWQVYLRNGSQRNSTGWRTLPCVALLLHGWFVCWGLLQAYLLAPEQKLAVILSATVANCAFIGGLVAWCAVLVGVGIRSTISGAELWDQYTTISADLRTFEASWTGTTDVSQLLRLSPEYKAVSDASFKWADWNTVEYGLVAGVCLLMVLLNMGSLGLTRLLRRQIKFKVDQLQKFTSTMGEERGRFEKNEPITVFEPDSSVLPGSSRPSRKEIRGLANDTGANGHRSEHARGIQSLQRAERDLVLMSASLAVIASFAASTLIFISVWNSSQSVISADWPTLEYMLLSVSWMYGLSLVGFTFAICFNLWVNMPSRPCRRNDVETLYMTSGSGVIRSLFRPMTHETSPHLQTSPTPAQQIQVKVERIEVENDLTEEDAEDQLRRTRRAML